MALNDRQRRFIDEYLVDLNGAQAAIRAGYSPRSARQRADVLLNEPDVAGALAAAQAALAERTGITQAMVLEELAKIGFANMGNYLHATTGGDPYFDFAGLTEEQKAALVEVTVEDFTEGRGEDARNIRRVKFKLGDKRAALVDIGKHLGMFKDRIEHTGKNGGPIETDSTVRIEFVRPKKDANDPDA
jgi:phage terminase small subunit